MSKTCENKNPLVREGSVQQQRLLKALVPQNLKLHDLDEKDWLKFVKKYAGIIAYYDKNPNDIAGDWNGFFPSEEEIEKIQNAYSSGEIQPHLSLFISFLKLLKFPQQGINNIPQRHLEFYYNQVLNIEPKTFQKDFVHVIFELAKNAEKELVEKGSLLEAGKDEAGISRFYRLEKDLVVNQARVSEIKSVYTDKDKRLHYAIKTNSIDGIKEELEDGQSFSAFGNDVWPLAPREVYLSSPLLRLKSGKRIIKVHWEFNKELEVTGEVFASVTQEKGWLENIKVTIPESETNTWTIELEQDEKAVTPYNEKSHENNLRTSEPVIKFHFKDPVMYRNLSEISLKGVKIEVEVNNLKELSIRNELGNLAPDKPFMPFGPRPKKNSKLKIKAPEFEGKNIDSYSINLPWLNMPANFDNHYSHYKQAIQAQRDEEAEYEVYLMPYLGDIMLEFNSGEGYRKIESNEHEIIKRLKKRKPSFQADTMRTNFRVLVSSPYNPSDKSHEMFPVDKAAIEIDTSSTTYLKGGEIELKLMEPFYHDLYNDLYVSVITDTPFRGVNPEELPNEPYTPLLDYLSLDYKASAEITLSDNSVSNQEIKVLRKFPFGHKLMKKRGSILPGFNSHQLFVGIESIQAKDHISLLFEVEEGSENPLHSSFEDSEGIRWSVLGQNEEWIPLKSENIIQNGTNNFLRSGIVEIRFPENTGHEHTLFRSDLVWLKIELQKEPDSVSRFKGVHAQAALASFVWRGNSLEHLYAGLPTNTIDQLAQRKSSIKSLTQPYPSFGGKPAENKEEYYRRTSERLRHKNRALAIWDYEHLVLQEFPSLYKVKCLNHTKRLENKVDELCPGSIILLVIPRLNDNNKAYRLKPMVSQDVKNSIFYFLKAKMPLHAQLEVCNPIYEEVRFQFQVRFYAEYEFDFYETQLQEELKKYLAPWIYVENAEIIFSNSLYAYEVVHFIENLEYVDYVEDFKMAQKKDDDSWVVQKEIKPLTSLSILVPAVQHIINEATIC